MRPNIDIENKVDGAVQDYSDEKNTSKQDAYTELLNHALTFQPLGEEEHTALLNHMLESYGLTKEQAEHSIKTGYTGIIRDYVSSSPGYSGDLIFAIFGYPETYTLFAYENGEITHEIDREAQQSSL